MGAAPDNFRDEMTGARAGDDVGGRGAHHQGLAEGPAGPPGAICHPSNAGVPPSTLTVPSQNSQLLIHVYMENSSSFPFSDSPRVEEKKALYSSTLLFWVRGKQIVHEATREQLARHMERSRRS